MNLDELEALLQNHDEFKRQGFRTDAHAASLVITRNHPPKGYKIRTPFGVCQILNEQEKDGKIQIVFSVSRKQLQSTINKIKRGDNP